MTNVSAPSNNFVNLTTKMQTYKTFISHRDRGIVWQGTNEILVDEKANVFDFIAFIGLCQKQIFAKNIYLFHWIKTQRH